GGGAVAAWAVGEGRGAAGRPVRAAPPLAGRDDRRRRRPRPPVAAGAAPDAGGAGAARLSRRGPAREAARLDRAGPRGGRGRGGPLRPSGSLPRGGPRGAGRRNGPGSSASSTEIPGALHFRGVPDEARTESADGDRAEPRERERSGRDLPRNPSRAAAPVGRSPRGGGNREGARRSRRVPARGRGSPPARPRGPGGRRAAAFREGRGGIPPPRPGSAVARRRRRGARPQAQGRRGAGEL